MAYNLLEVLNTEEKWIWDSSLTHHDLFDMSFEVLAEKLLVDDHLY